MEMITFSKLWNIVSKERNSSLHYARVSSLMEYLEASGVLMDIDENYLFYPKKVFRERGEVELLFFSENTIIVSNMGISGNLTVRSFFAKDVCKLELLNLNVNNSDVELLIHISGEEPINLSNIKDASIPWRNNFYKLILDIYARLIRVRQ